jgi:hypothetical protein
MGITIVVSLLFFPSQPTKPLTPFPNRAFNLQFTEFDNVKRKQASSIQLIWGNNKKQASFYGTTLYWVELRNSDKWLKAFACEILQIKFHFNFLWELFQKN